MGTLFILSAPSGAGKSTLARRVLAEVEGIAFSVSHTTRPPRTGEVPGRDYHYVSEADFRAMADRGAFLEWAAVHGHHYGTAEAPLRERLERGEDVLLDIDVQGARQVRTRAPGAVSLFVLPPGYAPLRDRLAGRGTEGAEQLSRRLARAREEAEAWREYDYLVVNDDLERSAAELRAIILAERCRSARRQEQAERILATFRAAGGAGA